MLHSATFWSRCEANIRKKSEFPGKNDDAIKNPCQKRANSSVIFYLKFGDVGSTTDPISVLSSHDFLGVLLS